ncbi:BrnA antitoxin family protein [Bdellovibrio sp. HCB290]|uniref:BrnA antitoxin family protein n=1 Tax=Bdellovibrio sp. HCB290 TaxID=3394356 RepID=UPI0039B55FB1
MKKHKSLKEAMKTAKQTKHPQKVAALASADVKVSISIRLDLEVLNWLKSEGQKQGIPYQTLANSLLKKASSESSLEERLEKIEKLMALKLG